MGLCFYGFQYFFNSNILNFSTDILKIGKQQADRNQGYQFGKQMRILITVLVICTFTVQCEFPAQKPMIRAPFSESLETIFSTLPTESDLQLIMYSADPVALAKLLQVIQIKNQQIACDAMIVYSGAIIGMIKSIKYNKQALLAQLDVVYQSVKEEISRLQKQIQRFTEEKDSLSLNKIRNDILNLVVGLDDVYKFVRDQSDKVILFSSQINGYQKNIQETKFHSSGLRKSLLQKKLQLSGLDYQIVQLERHLAGLRQKRMTVNKDAEKLSVTILDNQKNIDLGFQKINDLKNSIASSNNNIDSSKSQAYQIEIQMARLRTDLGLKVKRDTVLENQIKKLKDQLSFRQIKLPQREFDSLTNIIKIWNIFLPKFEVQNAEFYYNCFGAGNIETLQTGNVVVYILSGIRLSDFVLNNYGLSLSQSPNFSQNIQFMVTDIFGKTWQIRYGIPFENITSNGDFTCLNPLKLKSGKGKIIKIQNHYITIQADDKNTQKLNIGACSRLQSVTTVPEIGQTIYYKGINNNKNSSEINLYTASCI